MSIIVPHCRLLFKNQKGQAITELSLMMMFLAVTLLGMVFVSVFLSENISGLETLRYKMRKSMHDYARGPFTHKVVEERVNVNLPGRMKLVFNTPALRHSHRIEFYQGSYARKGISRYRKWGLRRKIEF